MNSFTTIISRPIVRFNSNQSRDFKVYFQARQISRRPKDKTHVLDSEWKIQDAGYVYFIHNLSFV